MVRFTQCLASLRHLGATPPSSLQFGDPQVLARSKTVWELCRALFLLRLCSVDSLVARSEQILLASRRLLGPRVWTSLLRPTIYRQFIGGASEKEMATTVRQLAGSCVRPMIMVSLEEPTISHNDREHREANQKILLNCVKLSSELALPGTWPHMQLKVTALLPTKALQQLTHDWLSETSGCPNTVPADLVANLAAALDGAVSTEANLEFGLSLLREVLDEAERLRVRLLVDAEYEDVNPGLAAVAYAAALRHNAQESLIWNTFQCYLKRTPKAFEAAVTFHKDRGLAFGAKIVRGAYMIAERERAAGAQVESPIHDSKKHTASCYDAVVGLLLKHVAAGQAVEGIVATHNEAALRNAVARMTDLGLPGGSGPVVFGQIYGMADNLSLPLSAAGYAVYKSIPFGSLEETVPYLCRRAQENRSVFAGAREERRLLWDALKLKL